MLKYQLTESLKQHLKFPESKNLQQRGIADKIEDACNEIIKSHFDNVIDARSCKSIEDITIDNTYVDHKSSDISKDLKMPNMISIARLKKLDRELLYNFIIYDSKQKKIVDTLVLNVYELNWDHLSIQGLGLGQLQITNMEKFLENPSTTLPKDEWKARLKQEAVKFCINQQDKFAKEQTKWESWV
jgi:hypothetical protein